MSIISLDKRQAEQLVRFITENHDRLPDGIHIKTAPFRSTVVEARSDGRITASSPLLPKGQASR